ncbi:VrrA/YqfQ family protein [Virgibacillus flavescens]|uniref:VrrA/YqfQ family protein n=1 Tax=Virgibacillus flavescens TaxID=1611422 RepID=UPI003D340729
MFPINNRPSVPQRQFTDPFSVRPQRSAPYPVSKPRSSVPLSITSFLNPSNGGLTKTLSNIQQVMNMVESAAPMIKEYGPMVKNLPAMIKMMKALNEPDEIDSETHTDTKQKSTNFNSLNKESKSSNEFHESKPKLFI